MLSLNLVTSPLPYLQNQYGNSHNPGQVPWGCQPVQAVSVIFSYNLRASLRRDQELAGGCHPFCYRCEYKPRLSLSCPDSDSSRCQGAATAPSYHAYHLFPLWRCTILSHAHHWEPSKTVSLPLGFFPSVETRKKSVQETQMLCPDSHRGPFQRPTGHHFEPYTVF